MIEFVNVSESCIWIHTSDVSVWTSNTNTWLTPSPYPNTWLTRIHELYHLHITNSYVSKYIKVSNVFGLEVQIHEVQIHDSLQVHIQIHDSLAFTNFIIWRSRTHMYPNTWGPNAWLTPSTYQWVMFTYQWIKVHQNSWITRSTYEWVIFPSTYPNTWLTRLRVQIHDSLTFTNSIIWISRAVMPLLCMYPNTWLTWLTCTYPTTWLTRLQVRILVRWVMYLDSKSQYSNIWNRSRVSHVFGYVQVSQVSRVFGLEVEWVHPPLWIR